MPAPPASGSRAAEGHGQSTALWGCGQRGVYSAVTCGQRRKCKALPALVIPRLGAASWLLLGVTVPGQSYKTKRPKLSPIFLAPKQVSKGLCRPRCHCFLWRLTADKDAGLWNGSWSLVSSNIPLESFSTWCKQRGYPLEHYISKEIDNVKSWILCSLLSLWCFVLKEFLTYILVWMSQVFLKSSSDVQCPVLQTSWGRDIAPTW